MPGMTVGVGSDPTVMALVEGLGQRVQKESFTFTAAAASAFRIQEARTRGITVVPLDH